MDGSDRHEGLFLAMAHMFLVTGSLIDTLSIHLALNDDTCITDLMLHCRRPADRRVSELAAVRKLTKEISAVENPHREQS